MELKSTEVRETPVNNYLKTKACGLVVINMRKKAQYSEATRVRVSVTGELTFRHRQG